MNLLKLSEKVPINFGLTKSLSIPAAKNCAARECFELVARKSKSKSPSAKTKQTKETSFQKFGLVFTPRETIGNWLGLLRILCDSNVSICIQLEAGNGYGRGTLQDAR